ncbi:hypothetical protein EBR21_02130 [bacterium]|nr:hypothetical protein [bacterium]
MANEPSQFAHAIIASEFQLGEIFCQLLETSDGSFSLRYSTDRNEMTEPMHSSKGAWSETLEIYEPALKGSLDFHESKETWRVASIGLGLGYNEILAAGVAMASGIEPDKISIVSFESRPELMRAFSRYFQNSEASTKSCFLDKVYADIVRRTSDLLNLQHQKLQTYIGRLICHKHLELHESLSKNALQTLSTSIEPCGCVLFDAFSPSSSPDLWNEELLETMIGILAGPKCIFASYASRTVLKKMLRRFGFVLQRRSGFAGKREATFAVRNSEF